MGAASPTRLDVETQFYEAKKSEWLKEYHGKFVVMKGIEVLGFFSDFHTAYRAGVEKYGALTDFLVKRVVPHEPVFVVF